MDNRYMEICDRISKIEHTKGFELTEQQIDAIYFYRKAMKNSLDFISQNSDTELRGLHENTFNLYYKILNVLLNELK